MVRNRENDRIAYLLKSIKNINAATANQVLNLQNKYPFCNILKQSTWKHKYQNKMGISYGDNLLYILNKRNFDENEFLNYIENPGKQNELPKSDLLAPKHIGTRKLSSYRIALPKRLIRRGIANKSGGHVPSSLHRKPTGIPRPSPNINNVSRPPIRPLNPNNNPELRPNMGQNVRPIANQGVGNRARPPVIPGMRPNMRPGVRPGMRPGMRLPPSKGLKLKNTDLILNKSQLNDDEIYVDMKGAWKKPLDDEKNLNFNHPNLKYNNNIDSSNDFKPENKPKPILNYDENIIEKENISSPSNFSLMSKLDQIDFKAIQNSLSKKSSSQIKYGTQKEIKDRNQKIMNYLFRTSVDDPNKKNKFWEDLVVNKITNSVNISEKIDIINKRLEKIGKEEYKIQTENSILEDQFSTPVYPLKYNNLEYKLDNNENVNINLDTKNNNNQPQKQNINKSNLKEKENLDNVDINKQINDYRNEEIIKKNLHNENFVNRNINLNDKSKYSPNNNDISQNPPKSNLNFEVKIGNESLNNSSLSSNLGTSFESLHNKQVNNNYLNSLSNNYTPSNKEIPRPIDPNVIIIKNTFDDIVGQNYEDSSDDEEKKKI